MSRSMRYSLTGVLLALLLFSPLSAAVTPDDSPSSEDSIQKAAPISPFAMSPMESASPNHYLGPQESIGADPPIDSIKANSAATEPQKPSDPQVKDTPEPFSPMEEFFNNADVTTTGTWNNRQQVATDTQKLRQFGYDFFLRGQIQPDQQSLVGPDYVLGPGDSLRVDLWGSIQGNYPVTIDRNGEITLPKVGVINLWGQTFTQAKETIRKQILKYYKDFELNVTLGSLRSIQIFLVGEVTNPGTYQVSSLSTLVTALSSVGGPAKSGSMRKIQLIRNGETIRTIDLYDFFLMGDKRADVRLQSGDTIFVPFAGPMISISGDIRRQAIYELKGGESVGDVFELAGGLTPNAFLQKVQVSRIDAHQSRIILDLNLANSESGESFLDFVLQDRDSINISPIAVSSGYITLEGYVARPGTYQLTPDMRLSTLIKDYENLLPEYYPGMAQIIRLSPPEYRPEIITVRLDLALQEAPEHDLPLQEYDTIQLYSRDEMEEIPQVTIQGAVIKGGTYRLYDNMTIKDLVSTAGNLKRNAYLQEAELTRYEVVGKETRTERLLINLEKALSGDPAENHSLQPFDYLIIRGIQDLSDRQSVTVEGQVLFPGTYQIAKSEKLSSVLARAGGFSEGAYLRGAKFNRLSAQFLQKERMNKLIFEQEQEIARVSAEIAAGALSSEELQSAQSVMKSRIAMVEKLRNVPIPGRMVVHLLPLGDFTDSIYDFELQNGDSITIPENPKSVSVLGQVYNPISLAYLSGKTVSFYLDKVGGATRDSDPDRMFIVRADGTVFSKQQAGTGIKWDSENNSWIFGGFEVTELYPGDTILVPEQIDTIDIMREVKDITTILYQIALGAAAIASF